MTYRENKQRARTVNTDPTLTEQSMARDTDINVIVSKFRISGTVPTSQHKPLAGDFTNLPGDLREMIETAKSLKDKRRQLPKELREMPIEELLTLTPDKLASILTPPAPPPANDKKEDK